MSDLLRKRYGSAKEVAGQTANNKAAIAGKMAKQAAAMSNNSKMTQALLGVQAMNDAVSSGFDEGLDRGANMAAQVASEDARAKEREQNQKQFEATQKLQREEAEKDRQFQRDEKKKDRSWNILGAAFGSFFK